MFNDTRFPTIEYPWPNMVVLRAAIQKRWPKGSGRGGQFRSKDDAGSEQSLQDKVISGHEKRLASRGHRGDIEACVIVDGNGNVLLDREGKENTVAFTKTELYKVRKQPMYSVEITHDHPGGAGFSIDDLAMCLQFDLKAVVAVGRAGLIEGESKGAYYLYRMESNGKSNYDQTVLDDIQNRVRGKYQDILYSQPEMKAYKGNDPMSDEGALKAIDRVNFGFTHEVSQRIAKEFGWTYTRELKHID